MNASARQSESVASFVETRPGYWTVTLGHEQRAITKEGPASYIAWIGHQSRHWCFAKALKACVENIQQHRDMVVEAQLAHDAAIASLMRMTPRQKADLAAKLTVERDMLDYAGAHMDTIRRKMDFDKMISRLRSI